MPSAEALTPRAIDILASLVAFDTTSRLSNLALIEWVEAYLDGHGVAHRRAPNHDGTKSNLLATVGPIVEGGVVLSGHTDVVPVDGQAWVTDPFVLTPKDDGRIYGRGTCDMKGFLALALAAVPDLAAADLKKPVHLAFSYDEEIGCLGAPDLIALIESELPRPALVVVGEPTDMVAVSGHKGISSFVVTVTGKEAHSSQTHLGVSANMEAVKLMAALSDLADRLEREADPASAFVPKHTTLTIGLVHGGTAGNILARECSFQFDLRCPPGQDPLEVLEPFFGQVAATDAAMKARFPEAGAKISRRSGTPAMSVEKDGAAEAFARRLAGDNGPARVVPYAAEAGQFQQAGFSTVICGPGSIDQAHQANEFVERSQMERGAAFMARLVDWAARGE
ncbi:acetylornithine deacetylase [Phenylobacterium sp.]|uniref:acetylornithine deacetylase n=1 Tax=Phenylobacterium sp. TaxID=1871053 RepID=UPI0027365BBF|nr:acetylornithine deacetylase [Phenylobacterium sp.]MDP3852989.1 acetylornithine deacetylase [Phenylobacterium sp.]